MVMTGVWNLVLLAHLATLSAAPTEQLSWRPRVSRIRGVLTPERAAAMSARGRPGVDPAGGQPYAAAALSLVFHPRSPMVPTFRADVRRFTVDGTSWFGGGADLTPYYLRDEDAVAFHAHWRAVCNAHDAAVVESEAETEDRSGPLHARCKRWCDEYFYIPARKEHRGVGGIFFDDMSDDENETGVADVARARFTLPGRVLRYPGAC